MADENPDIDMLNSIHRRMHDELELVGGHTDAIFFSTENPDDSADMLNQIVERFYSDLANVPVIENTHYPSPGHWTGQHHACRWCQRHPHVG